MDGWMDDSPHRNVWLSSCLGGQLHHHHPTTKEKEEREREMMMVTIKVITCSIEKKQQQHRGICYSSTPLLTIS